MTKVHVDGHRATVYSGTFAKGSSRETATENVNFHTIFFDKDNLEKTKELGLQKFSNSTVRKIVLWSLPQVCQLYLVNECERVECPFLHLCPGMVRGFLYNCAFSHCLVDTHNKGIIKRYDLLPSPLMSLDFVCRNILVLNEPKLTSKYQLSGDNGTAIHASNALTTATVPEVTSVSSLSLNTGCHMKDDQSNGAAETVSSIISTTCQPKQTEFVSGVKSEMKTGKRKKKRNRKRMKIHVGQVKATGPRPNCNSTHPVNNLASHSVLSGSTDTPQFLNIEERDNLSDASSNENNDTSSNSMKGNQSLAERKQRDSHLSVVRFNFEDIRGNENLNKNSENLQENRSNTSSGNRAWAKGAGYHCADKETVSSDPFETVTKAAYNSPTQSASPPENISETFDEKLPRPSSQTQVSELLSLSKATPSQTQMCKVAPSEIKVSKSAISQIQVPKSVSLQSQPPGSATQSTGDSKSAHRVPKPAINLQTQVSTYVPLKSEVSRSKSPQAQVSKSETLRTQVSKSAIPQAQMTTSAPPQTQVSKPGTPQNQASSESAPPEIQVSTSAFLQT